MVELNGTHGLAFHEKRHVGGLSAAAATARDRCVLLSSRFPSLAARHLAAVLKSNDSILNGEEGRAMAVHKRNVQLKHSEKIVIKKCLGNDSYLLTTLII